MSRMARATSSAVRQSTYRSSAGRRVWSMSRTPPAASSHSTVAISSRFSPRDSRPESRFPLSRRPGPGSLPTGSSGGGPPPGRVQPPRRVAVQVEGHEGVAGAPDGFAQATSLLEQPSHVRRLDLDPGHLAVVADADLPDAQRPDRGLRRLDSAQDLRGDLGAVRDPGGEAGEGG